MDDFISFVRFLLRLVAMAGIPYFMYTQYETADKIVHGRHVQLAPSFSAGTPGKTETAVFPVSRDVLAG